MKNLKNINNNFKKYGFAVIKNLLTKKKIKEIKEEISKIKIKSLIIKNPHVHLTKDKKINTIHNINKYLKKGKIIDFSKSKKIKKIVNEILEDDFKIRNIEFFLKPKKTGMASPHHQDNYYWKIKNKKAINIWVACSKANINNGGVYYISGSHKHGLKKHITSFSPGSSYKIKDNIIKKMKSKKIYPSLNTGDAIIHHCEVIHGSAPNKSNIDREGLVISFKANSAIIDRKKLKSYHLNVKKNLNYLKKNKR